MRAFLAGLALFLSASPVFAAGEGGSWYLGVGGGQSSLHEVCSYFGTQSSGGTCDDESVGWKLYAGRDLSNNFGFEVSFTDAGEAKIVGPTSSPGTLKVHPRLVTFSGKLEIPFGELFSIFGKAGLTYFKVDYNRTGSFLALNSGDDGLEPSIGAGFGVRFSRHFGVRAEWENFNDAVGGLRSGDIDLVTASVLYRF